VKGSVSYWQTSAEGLDRDMTAIFSDTGSFTASQIKDIYPQYADYCPYSQGWDWKVRSSGTVPVPEVANPETWLPITMRLTNGVPEIAAYDMVGYTPSGASAITNWAFEGSVDGRNWVNLTNVDFSAESMALNSSTWYSTKLANGIPKRTLQAGEGFPLPGRGTAGAVQPLANVASVFVAPGATLVADGMVTISKLASACAGAEKGTLRGFTLALIGTLDVRGAFDGRTQLALAFEEVEGVENLANWAVTSGGKPLNLKVSVKDGEVFVTKVGLVVTVL